MVIDLCDVPKEKQTYEMCLESVKYDWAQIKYVRKTSRTQELRLEAVKQNGWALKYVKPHTTQVARFLVPSLRTVPL